MHSLWYSPTIIVVWEVSVRVATYSTNWLEDGYPWKPWVLHIHPLYTATLIFVLTCKVFEELVIAIAPTVMMLKLRCSYVEPYHQKALKCSELIIKNLVCRGNQTPAHCYNNSITITPLDQTSYIN